MKALQDESNLIILQRFVCAMNGMFFLFLGFSASSGIVHTAFTFER